MPIVTNRVQSVDVMPEVDALQPQLRQPAQHGTIEAEVFKRVIKENWKSKVNAESSKQLIAMLEEHAAKMQSLLGSYDYEIISLPYLIASCKKMAKSEATRYLRLLEATATGYKQRFSNELVVLLMLGISLKAKDVDSVKKYYDLFITEAEAELASCSTSMGTEHRKLESTAMRLRYEESSIINRLFRKKRLVSIRKKVEKRAVKVKKLQAKRSRYSGLISSVKEIASNSAPEGQ